MLLVTRELMVEVLFNDLNLELRYGGYGFLMRLDLMFSVSLQEQFQLLQILNDLSIRHLIKLILCDNNVKFLKFKRSLVYDMFEV